RRAVRESGQEDGGAPQAAPGAVPDRAAPAEAMPLPGVLRAGRDEGAGPPAGRRLWSVRRGDADGDG
uniref:hypothetical protein n=1 Tax=Rhodosalinus sediminis TaxID=1940533 RepID=UPI002355EC27